MGGAGNETEAVIQVSTLESAKDMTSMSTQPNYALHQACATEDVSAGG